MYKMNQLIDNQSKKKIYLNKMCNKQIIISFYKYFFVLDTKELFYFIKLNLEKKNIFGRIYIATEGINGIISIPFKQYKYIKHFFKNLHSKTKKIYMNCSIERHAIVFLDLRIKIKKQIVSSKMKDFSLRKNIRGIYLNAFLVNKYFLNKKFVFVDMRNSYEYAIGHFRNAINIPAQTFREQLKKLPKALQLYHDKKIVMYCTGGVRCEKSTALLKNFGFSNVYHIYGGILSYITQTKKYNLPNYFQGKIFLFDSRLEKKITNDVFSKCINCKKYTNRAYINCFNNFCHRLMIQCKVCSIKLQCCCSVKCNNKLKI